MNISAEQMLSSFDRALETSSRWPRLLLALGFDPATRPGPRLLNNALEKRGYRRAIDEDDALISLLGPDYPKTWWSEIARTITGNSDALTSDIVKALARDKTA